MFVLLGLLTALSVGTQPPGPSAAVLVLTPKAGVSREVAEILTEKIDLGIRASKHFPPVVSSTDVQAMLSMEVSRQLAACDSKSSMAELAGSLGVDYIVTGNVGSVGELWILNLRVIDVDSGMAAAAVSRTVEGSSQAALVRAVDSVVVELVQKFRERLRQRGRRSPLQVRNRRRRARKLAAVVSPSCAGFLVASEREPSGWARWRCWRWQAWKPQYCPCACETWRRTVRAPGTG